MDSSNKLSTKQKLVNHFASGPEGASAKAWSIPPPSSVLALQFPDSSSPIADWLAIAQLTLCPSRIDHSELHPVKMSLGQDAVEFGAEKKFWASPELVDKLLRRLDLDSTKKLAESHKLTRQILGRPFHWSKLIKHTFQEGDSINVNQWSLPKEDDVHLASMRPRVKLLSEILNQIDEPEPELELNLLHTICDSYLTENISKVSDWPRPDMASLEYCAERLAHQEPRRNYVSVSCPCHQIHQVSPWGFVLLNDVEDTLGSRKQGIEEVVVLTRLNLQGPLLTALASKVAQQLEMVKKLNIYSVACDNKECAEAFATLVEHSSEEALQGWPTALISATDGVGAEGWAAIRRAVECLAKVRPWAIVVRCQREAMIGGRKDDLKVGVMKT